MQLQIANYFGIPYATYSSEYFNIPTNTLYIQNGLSATGIRKGYTQEYLSTGTIPISSMSMPYIDSPGAWPNFNAVSTNNGELGGGYRTMNPSISMTPYSVLTQNFQFGSQFLDSNYYIQTNKTTRSVDIIATIEPAKYTVFKFRSSARQTLQVETLPLPYYYRFSDYNAKGLYKGVIDHTKQNIPQMVFDISYSYLYLSTQNALMDSSKYSTMNGAFIN
jgi:hypothetical protein